MRQMNIDGKVNVKRTDEVVTNVITNDDELILQRPWLTERIRRSLMVGSSFVIWAVTSLLCLMQYNKKYKGDLKRFPYLSFIISSVTACLGISEFLQEDILYSLRGLLDLLELNVAVPCITTEIWLKHRIAQKEVAWAHIGVGLIPTYVFLFQHYTRHDLVDFTIIMNVVSLIIVGLMKKDLYIIIAGIIIFCAHFILNDRHEIAREMQSRPLFNCTLAIFTYCGYKAVM